MKYKTYTTKLYNPTKQKNMLTNDIYPEIETRSLLEGIVLKEVPEKNEPIPGSSALVSLYQARSDGYKPIYHTYSDEKGRFLFPIVDTKGLYQVKVNYLSPCDNYDYKPYESKSIRIGNGTTHQLICTLYRNNRRLLIGTLMNRKMVPASQVPIELYLTIGQNKVPILALGSTRTGYNGDFRMNITPDGNYCLRIILPI